jgi:hypothetical protein
MPAAGWIPPHATAERRGRVLYSRASRIAFAHYPKTGGTSLQQWFREAFPDAQLLVPDNPHLPCGRRWR